MSQHIKPRVHLLHSVSSTIRPTIRTMLAMHYSMIFLYHMIYFSLGRWNDKIENPDRGLFVKKEEAIKNRRKKMHGMKTQDIHLSILNHLSVSVFTLSSARLMSVCIPCTATALRDN